MAYESLRHRLFRNCPSRLDCLFCFPTRQEAELCRTNIEGYAKSVLYEVESAEATPHIADMNNGLQHFALAAFDDEVIADYWRGWQRSLDPQAVILREVLLRSPATIRRRI
ncbi:hypothetical protein [Acidiphilium iwatense]|nr:hypothetical protein [Acidiphilium iwatense]